MVCLYQSVLVRPELFQFLFKQLRLVVCYRLLVEDENLGDVVVVSLVKVSYSIKLIVSDALTLSFKSFSTWFRSRLIRLSFFRISSTLLI